MNERGEHKVCLPVQFPGTLSVKQFSICERLREVQRGPGEGERKTIRLRVTISPFGFLT